jgi:hypothetical protein
MSHVWSDEEVKSFKLLLRKISENLHYEEDHKMYHLWEGKRTRKADWRDSSEAFKKMPSMWGD